MEVIVCKKNSAKLVLGNGFDLFCGLKTKYIDYFNSQKKEYDEIIKWNKSITDFRIYLKRSVQYWDTFGPHYQCEIDNIWDIYFALEIGERDCDWWDIEKEILDTLKINDSNCNYWDEIFKSISKKMAIYVESKSQKAIAAYFITKNVDVSNTQKFYYFVLSELNKFEEKFGKYVNKEYVDNYFQKVEPSISLFENWVTREISKNIISVDTFNYTNNKSVKKQALNLFNNIHHINGDYNKPIFGVDSTELNVNLPHFLFTKVARRMINITKTTGVMNSSFDNNFDILIVFGHSLNQQDYNYFFPIFDYLELTNITKSTSLVFLYYVYDEQKRESIILEQISRVTCLIDAYEGYAGEKKTHRLIDSLTMQGRISIREIYKETK